MAGIVLCVDDGELFGLLRVEDKVGRGSVRESRVIEGRDGRGSAV